MEMASVTPLQWYSLSHSFFNEFEPRLQQVQEQVPEEEVQQVLQQREEAEQQSKVDERRSKFLQAALRVFEAEEKEALRIVALTEIASEEVEKGKSGGWVVTAFKPPG